jgi:hypothetical protein
MSLFQDCQDCWFCRVGWNEVLCVHPRNPYKYQEVTTLPTSRVIMHFKNRTDLPPLIPPVWCVLKSRMKLPKCEIT